MTAPSGSSPAGGRGLDPSPGARRSGRRFVPVTVLLPVLAATVGLDGGPIFQIVAVENLGLSAKALGIAFGFGVVSLPAQLAAARMPLRWARRNVQSFLVVIAIQAWILAALVATGATGGLAAIALGVTVSAELAVSILFATAWQPLLSVSVDHQARQRLNSAWPAVARGVLAGSLVAFGALSDGWRPVFLAAVGAAAVAAAIGLARVPPPRPPAEPETVDGFAPPAGDADPTADPAAAPLALIFVVLGVANLGAMPLWLVYLEDVLWRGGNLGLVAAVQTTAAMAAMLAWRPTDGDVSRRALLAAIVTLAGTCSIVLVRGPDPGGAGQAVVLTATALSGAGVTTTRIALLELVHRSVDSATAVRVFTVLDVVASTSLQVGLVAAGFLITAAASTSTWPADPYQLLIIAAAIATVAALRQLRASRP